MTDATGRPDGFARAAGVLWRDTGAHVVALPTAGSGDVIVLGGGSAQIWRLLRRPRSLAQLVDAFVDEAGAPPPQQHIAAAAADLVARGVVRNSQVV
ncbi:MAG TPA: PqqD family protein [Nocardioidaceae bacterium]|nr:PqqD family protein [Nocardioidaceae bacterium]